MLAWVKVPNFWRALGVQREADRGTVVLVERRPGVAQVAAGHGGDAAHRVVHRGRRRAGGPLALARQDLDVGRHVAGKGLAGRRLVHERALLDQLELEQRRGADDLLGPVDVGHAGQLHQDLVVAAVAGDHRLGHAELVDPALDGLQRLVHRLLAELVDDHRLQAEGVVGPRLRPVVGEVDVDQRLAELRVLRRRHPGDAELAAAGHGHPADGDVLGAQGLAQPVGRRLGLDPQRVVGLHPHHQVHPALEIEAEAHLFLGRREGPDRQPEHGHDGQQFPAQVLRHVCRVSSPRMRSAAAPDSPPRRRATPRRARSGRPGAAPSGPPTASPTRTARRS